MPGEHRAHTPITSKAQQGLFGAELARRRAGEAPQMNGITTKELVGHLHESAGKELPAKAKAARPQGRVQTTRQAAGLDAEQKARAKSHKPVKAAAKGPSVRTTREVIGSGVATRKTQGRARARR